MATVLSVIESAGYEWELIIENEALVIPPERNVEETNWQEDRGKKENDLDSATSHKVEEEISGTELDNIRRQLEGLL